MPAPTEALDGPQPPMPAGVQQALPPPLQSRQQQRRSAGPGRGAAAAAAGGAPRPAISAWRLHPTLSLDLEHELLGRRSRRAQSAEKEEEEELYSSYECECESSERLWVGSAGADPLSAADAVTTSLPPSLPGAPAPASLRLLPGHLPPFAATPLPRLQHCHSRHLPPLPLLDPLSPRLQRRHLPPPHGCPCRPASTTATLAPPPCPLPSATRAFVVPLESAKIPFAPGRTLDVDAVSWRYYTGGR